MSDVFISYATGDRQKAAELAAAMEGNSWTVWWDRQIPPGRTFDEVIEEALTAARCVIVLWSGQSVTSRWVRAEASTADERGILVPALIEHVSPPLEFRRIQAADLVNWRGEGDDVELRKLLATVGRLVSRDSPAAASHRPPKSQARAWLQLPIVRYGSVAFLGLLAGAALVYSLRPSGDQAASRTDRAQTSETVRGPQETQAAGIRQPQEHTGAVASGTRLNLLSMKNGGHLLRAPSQDWNQPIDDVESWDYIRGDEAVYGFKDERPAVFDAFRMLITETRDWNVKSFELLAGNGAPDGHFESIGTFETQNVRLFPSPWQEFRFTPTRAKYLKVRVLSIHRPPGTPQVEQWQLLGSF